MSTPSGSAIERYMPGGDMHDSGSRVENLFDLATIRGILWRQKFIVAAIVALALLIGLTATLLMTPIYTAQSTVRVNPNSIPIVQGQDLVDPYMASNEIPDYITTLTYVIESRSLAKLVAERLELDTDPDFGGAAVEASRDARLATAAAVLRQGVSAEVEDTARVITISYRSPDPGMAQKVANAYADAFVVYDLTSAADQNVYARDFLEGQIAEVRQKLRDAELQANNYARANRLVGQPMTGEAGSAGSTGTGIAPTLTASNLSGLNERLMSARADRISAEQRWRAIADRPAAILPEVQQNSSVQSLNTRIAELRSRIANLRERYQDDYPELQEALVELRTAQSELNSTQQEIKAGIRNQYETAQMQEQALAQAVENAADSTLDEQDRRVQYNIYDRDAEGLRTQLASLVTRYNDLQSAANARTSDLSVLDYANRPGAPTEPNLLRNLLVSLVLGLGIAALIVILRELLDDRLRTTDEVARKTGLPVLGQTPNTKEGIEHELENPFSPLGEVYSSIRASLDAAMDQKLPLVLQFTSTQPGEGKTTSAIALGEKYASLGRKTLIVDFDLRRPSAVRSMGLKKPKLGLVDVLYGRARIEDALVASGFENLSVLGVVKPPENPVEILSSGLIDEFIAKVRRQWDVVILDSCPVIGIADAPLMSRHADGVLFVIEANRAQAGQTRHAIRRLRDVDANVAGAVLTKYKPLEAGEGYRYAYNYYAYEAADTA
ncbi:GumC family protein [Aurantiacibacter spongiae]|nr:polysaccharide biosynthesis tyrosine autokinase [Aurantiacibacter spongiae]